MHPKSTPELLPEPENPNPSGLCQCGCGQPTPIATATATARRHVKGFPKPYIPGHKNGPDRTPLEDRFWAKVNKTDGCWLWTGFLGQNGYGRISRGGRYGKDDGAHRISWELHFGPIPDDMWVCHHCDNPACVRPDHLFLGRARDNVADKIRKGRSSMGHRNAGAKLTQEDVESIRHLAAAGVPQVTIAAKFGVSRSTVSAVVLRQRYQW